MAIHSRLHSSVRWNGFWGRGHNPGRGAVGAMRLGPDSALRFLGFDIVSPFDHYGGYNYEDDGIRAFSHTHLVGAGVGDYGNFGMMPLVLEESITDVELRHPGSCKRAYEQVFS